MTKTLGQINYEAKHPGQSKIILWHLLGHFERETYEQGTQAVAKRVLADVAGIGRDVPLKSAKRYAQERTCTQS